MADNQDISNVGVATTSFKSRSTDTGSGQLQHVHVVDVDGSTPGLAQILDANNSQAITSSEASPGSPWVGTATQTRSAGVVGVFLSAISTSALGGTYTFEFGEDGVTWPISIPLSVDDFSTIRFRQLLNAGEYFRASFEPDNPLGAETVFLTTQLAKQADPPFVVPASHEFEEADAAFGSIFSFPKEFNQFTGLSENVRSDAYAPALASSTPLGSGATFDSGIIDATAFNYVSTELLSDVSGSLTVSFYDDLAGTTELRQFTRPYTGGEGFAIFGSILTRPYYRYVYTNGGTAQTQFHIATKFHKNNLAGQILGLEDFIPTNVIAQVTRSVQTGITPSGAYENLPASGIDTNNSSTTPLGISGQFSGTFTDVGKYSGTSIFIKADVDSASGGLKIIHSSDGVTDDRVISLFYDASENPQGIIYLIPASTEYFRLEYDNNTGTAQTSFIVEVKHTITALQSPILPVNVSSTDNSTAALVKSILELKNDAGTYSVITQSDNGGVRQSIVEHEVSTPIKNLDSVQGNNTALTTTAVKIVDSAALPTGTKTVTVQASNNNGNKLVYVGTSSSLTTATTCNVVELGAGQAYVMELGTGLSSDLWAAMDTSTGRCIVSYLKDSTAP